MHQTEMERDYSVYAEWMTTWRKWRKAWCESTDAVVNFDLKFLAKNRTYESTHHAHIISLLAGVFPRVRIDKQGVVEVSTGSAVMKTMHIVDNKDSRFGIVILRTSLFTRPDLLRIGLVIEKAGHKLLYDFMESDTPSASRAFLPYRDDPVWEIIAANDCSIGHTVRSPSAFSST